MQKTIEYIEILLLDISAVILIGLQMKLVGYGLLIIGMVLLLLCSRQFKKDIALIYICLAILGLTPITTDISYTHILQMGIPLFLVVMLPYFVSKYVYKDHLVRFTFHHGRGWYKTEIGYVFFTAIVSYMVIPFYLRNTGAYRYWTVDPGVTNLLKLFIGTNFLGIWDELFFISTVLGILRRYMSFQWANLVQSIMFTSFLYELGFRGWGFIMIFIFALIQGYVFKKTESLLYVITIHLTLDLILYLALIHAHHPSWVPIFLTYIFSKKAWGDLCIITPCPQHLFYMEE